MTNYIPDDLLSAYVDGELDGSERARVEQAIAEDARLAMRVARQRALRERLRAPLPQRLVNATRLEGNPGPAQIIDLARVRAARARRTDRRRLPLPGRGMLAVAASFLMGAGAALLIEHVLGSSELTEFRDGSLLASGALDRALSEQLSSDQPGPAAVRIGLSFHSKSGGYCRTFELQTSHALTGLACGDRQHWRILTLLATGGTPRTSGSTPPAALLQTLNEHISGEPLDASGEAKARRDGWH